MDLKAKPFYLSDEDIKWVEETKASLTLDEKLGQLFFPIGYSPNEQYLQYEILSKNPGGLMFRTGKTEELFNEGQCDYQATFSQEFSDHWNEDLRNAKDDLAWFELEW